MTSDNNLYQYKCHIVWQQIIAIDVKFNTFRNNNFSNDSNFLCFQIVLYLNYLFI